MLLQTINGLRDAAQHHRLDVSEELLYMHAQGGVTLFRDLCVSIFGLKVGDILPSRVLPISTSPPTTLASLFDTEIGQIKKVLGPGKRRKVEAEARLRPLAILNSTIAGEKGQPSIADLRSLAVDLIWGKGWQEVFIGAASIEVTASGAGPNMALRITKKEGSPIQLVPEGTQGASVVAVIEGG